MRTRLTTLFAAIGLLLFFLPGKSEACSCKEFTPCEAFGYSSAVFIGQLIDATEKVSERVVDGKTIITEAGQCTFSIEEAFKGVTGTTVKIFVAKDTYCGSGGLVHGIKYIVYASYNHSTGLSIVGCSPSTPVEYGKDHIEFLHNLPKEGVGGRIFGHVGVEKGSGEPAPMAGIMVVVKSDANQEFKAITNGEGYYEITGLKPGRYTVEANLPEHYDAYEPKREFEISDRGCVQQNYWTTVKGSISGRVVDSEGRTAPAHLHLRSVDNEEQRFLDIACDNGEFNIEDVPPGRYLLYLEIISAGKDEDSGEGVSYFYPGTFERKYAKVTDVGLGQQLTGYSFTLPSKLKVQLIRGVIKYPDGKPAANAAVIAIIKDLATPEIYRTSEIGRVEADAEGRFEIHGFKSNTYELTAQENFSSAFNAKRGTLFSEPLTLKLNADTKDIKLSLTTTVSPADR